MKKLNYLVAPLAAFTLFLAGCPTPNNGDTGPADTGPVDTGSDTAVNETGSDATDTPPPTDGGDAMMAANDCATYCAAITSACTGANAQYTDMADCTAYCAQAMWPAGTPGEAAGNTLACRIYHAGVAAGTPDVHCPHAGPSGAAVCGTVNFRTDMATTYTRVDRMGMPAVSTALVPSARKNAYNDGDPSGDMSFAGDFITTLTGLHTALDADLNTLHLTPCSMTSVAGALPECLSQMYSAGHTVASLVVPNDVITLDTTVAAGFPNGRRLEDPVIDVTLAVLLLRLNIGLCGTGTATCTAATLAMLPLNPAQNDVTNLTDWPYLAPPHAP